MEHGSISDLNVAIMADSFGRSIAVKYDENTIFTPLRKNAHLIILINSTAILKAADEVFLINKAVRVSPKKLIKKNINIPLDIVNISPVVKKFLIRLNLPAP